MTRGELLASLDCREMDLRVLSRDVATLTQTVPGAETGYKLRHVMDTLNRVMAELTMVSSQVREIPEW